MTTTATPTILPNVQGLRLLRAWLTEDEGWVLDEALPILAIAIDSDLNPQFIVPGDGPEELTNTATERSRNSPPSTVEWATALVDHSGRITDCFGRSYENPGRYLAALRARGDKLKAAA